MLSPTTRDLRAGPPICLLEAEGPAKDATTVEDHLAASIHQEASNIHSDEDLEDESKPLDARVQKLIRTYLEVFVELPPPASCDKQVPIDLMLKRDLVGHKIRPMPYLAPKDHTDKIQRQIQKSIDAGLVLEYNYGGNP